MAANYREGPYVQRPSGKGINPTTGQVLGYETVTDGYWQGHTWRQGPVDWDDAGAMGGYRKRAQQNLSRSKGKLQFYEKYPNRDYLIKKGQVGQHNPYYSQGLGPENYIGKYQSDIAADRVRFWEASVRKFDIRSQEFAGIEAAGGQEAYDEQQAAKKLLGKPRAEGARAAELLRQGRRQAGGGGAAPAQAGRQGQRARSAERRRMASNDATVGGGSSPRKRLHAKQLLRQPLGAGTQSAAQVLG
jgi:hypothetical protein